jgi:hypothetical protein
MSWATQLFRAECVCCPWAAGRNVGGHYKGHFFSLSSSGSLLILPEGVVVGFRNLAWAPNSQKYQDSNPQKNIRDPPTPLTM